MKKIKTLHDLEGAERRGLASLYPDTTKIMVGMATCGLATGARAVFQAIEEEVKKQGLNAIVTKTACLGYCQKEPLVDVLAPNRPRILFTIPLCGERMSMKIAPTTTQDRKWGMYVTVWATRL